MLKKVEVALRKIKIHGMSVSDIRGFGQQKDPSFPHYSSNLVHEFVPKVRLEIFCPDDKTDNILETIYENGRTGRIGDGKIFVLPVERAKRIRTGEEGEEVVKYNVAEEDNEAKEEN